MGEGSEKAAIAALGAGTPGKAARRVLRAIEALLRIAGTGFLFAVFGVGAVFLAHGLLRITGRGLPRRERELLAQARLQRWFRLYLRLGIGIGILDLSGAEMEQLQEGPALVVANHPTLLDVVFLLSFMPQGDCIVKREAWNNPALRGIVSAAGYIPNDDGEQLIETCRERLEAGRSVVIFPEGSRSPETGLGLFKRGAAHVALRTGCRVIPVLITCDPPALKKGQAWYALPNARLCYSLRAGEPFTAGEIVGDDLPAPVAARKITAHLREYFESELEHAID